MWYELQFPSLLAVLIAATTLGAVSAAWLYLVMRRTRAARINLRVLGVSVEIDMTRDKREKDHLSRRECNFAHGLESDD